jgi:hypothetical protein
MWGSIEFHATPDSHVLTTQPYFILALCSSFVLKYGMAEPHRFPPLGPLSAPTRNVCGEGRQWRCAGYGALPGRPAKMIVRPKQAFLGVRVPTKPAEEARKIAKAITRIPEFMMQRRGFYSRGQGNYRFKPARPYQVTFEDGYPNARPGAAGFGGRT